MVLPILIPLVAAAHASAPFFVGVGGVFASVWIGHWKDHFPPSEQDLEEEARLLREIRQAKKAHAKEWKRKNEYRRQQYREERERARANPDDRLLQVRHHVHRVHRRELAYQFSQPRPMTIAENDALFREIVPVWRK